MTEPELLKLDYEKTLEVVNDLSNIRFKLLGLLPLATGGTLALAEYGKDPLTAAVLAVLGSVGIMFYDQRNTELYERQVRRAKLLEIRLGLPKASSVERCGGPLVNRASRGRRFLGVRMWHDRGLILIYSICLSVWAYLLTSSLIVLSGAGARSPALWGVAAGAAVFVATSIQLHALDSNTPSELRTMDAEIKNALSGEGAQQADAAGERRGARMDAARS